VLAAALAQIAHVQRQLAVAVHATTIQPRLLEQAAQALVVPSPRALAGVNYLDRSTTTILAGRERELLSLMWWSAVLVLWFLSHHQAVGKSRTPQGLSTGLPVDR
jgi:hypothetical protein